MKKKTKQFIQHLEHDVLDEDRALEQIEEALPLVGWIILAFNALEKDIGDCICFMLCDRSDAVGLVVLDKLMYGAKLDLFKRLCDQFHLTDGIIDIYPELVSRLENSGRVRNLVVHADWSNTDEHGFTFTKLRVSEKGMIQEYTLLSKNSLEEILESMHLSRDALSIYWEKYTLARALT